MKAELIYDFLKSVRSWSFAVIALAYIMSVSMGVWTFYAMEDVGMPVLWRLFAADFVATVFVWLWGVVFDNSSIYDPYWSVAPPLMLTGYALFCGTADFPVVLMILVIWYWGVRLTTNWAYTFRNLNIQDWRYDFYRQRFPSIWHLTNFFGIHLMPTVVVFLAMIPGFLLIDSAVAGQLEANAFTWAGFIICFLATTLEMIADWQAHKFRRSSNGKVCNRGLWSVSRHPNYLGEIMMWWGLYVMYLTGYKCMDTLQSIVLPAVGAIANTILFICVSIPLMEQRQLSRKPEYADYMKKVRKLI